jgi:hypothetical protein
MLIAIFMRAIVLSLVNIAMYSIIIDIKVPFMLYRALWKREPINIAFLKKPVQYCIGEKDFATFL